MDLEERFWSKVNILDEDDCWEWTAGIDTAGYGAFKYNGKKHDSNRMTWFITYGEFPELLVCHTCDNKLCCNPNHLFLGTYKDNAVDMTKKGRRYQPTIEQRARGENSGMSKFLNKDVLEMLDLYHNKGYSSIDITKIYNISRRQITGIVSGEYRKEQYNFFFKNK